MPDNTQTAEEMVAGLAKGMEALEKTMESIVEKMAADEGEDGEKTIKRFRPKEDVLAKGEDDDGEGDEGDDADAVAKAAEVKKAADAAALKAKKKGSDAEDAKDGGADEDQEDDWSKAKKGVLAKGIEDESIEIGDQVIFKSAVGVAQFAVLKAQQEQIDKGNESIEKERDLRLTAEFAKRADDLYAHVPGSLDERVGMLKVIAGVKNEKVRKSFEAVFTQSEKLAKAAFEMTGSKGGGDEIAKGKAFLTKVSEIAKRDSIPRVAAMTKARHEDPEGFKAYQASN